MSRYINSRNSEEFLKVVRGCQLVNNQQRRAAEKCFFDLRKNSVDEFMCLLMGLVMGGDQQQPRDREFSALALRRNVQMNSPTWDGMAGDAREFVANGLSNMLLNESKSRQVRRYLSEAMGTLGARLFQQGGKPWPGLMGTVNKLMQSQEPAHLESAFVVLGAVAEFAVGILSSQIDGLNKMIASTLTNPKVHRSCRVAAAQTAAAIMLAPSHEVKAKSKGLMGAVMSAMASCYERRDDDELFELLEPVMDMAGANALLYKPSFTEFSRLLSAMLTADWIEPNVRRCVLSLCAVLCQCGPFWVRRHKTFLESVANCSLNMICDLQDDEEWQNFTVDHLEDFPNHTLGGDTLARVAHAVGGDIFIPLIMERVRACLSDNGWQQRHAAFVAMGSLTAGCPEKLKESYGSLLEKVIFPCLKSDPYYRVRWAAIMTLDSMSSEFAPAIHVSHGDQIVNEVLTLLVGKNTHPRLVRLGAMCLTDFLQGPENNTFLRKYIDAIVNQVFPLLERNLHVKVHEALLSLLATCALVAEADFSKYYKEVMPGLLGLLNKCTSDEQAGMRGRAVECIGFLAEAVGADTLGNDAKAICQLLVGYLGLSESRGQEQKRRVLDASDHEYHCIINALCKVAKVAPDALAPHLSTLIPPLLKSAGRDDVGAYIDGEDKTKYDDAEGYATRVLDVRHVGKTRLTLNPTVLKEKEMATEALNKLSEVMGLHFLDYLESVANVLCPLTTFSFSNDLRGVAVEAMPHLFKVACLALKACSTDNTTRLASLQKSVKNLWVRMRDALLVSFTKEVCVPVMMTLCDSMGELIKDLPFKISDKYMEMFAQLALGAASLAKEKRVEKAEEACQELDAQLSPEELEEWLEDEADKEDGLILSSHSLVEAVVRNRGSEYVTVFHKQNVFAEYWQYFCAPVKTKGGLLVPHSDSQITAALCVFGDVIEHGMPAAGAYIQSFFPIAMRMSQSDNPHIRETGVFGVGVCLQHIPLGDKFRLMLPSALHVVKACLENKEANEADWRGTTDCAALAVLKIIRWKLLDPALAKLYNGEGDSTKIQLGNTSLELGALKAGLFNLVMQRLPCRHCGEESKSAHELFLSLLEDSGLRQVALKDTGRLLRTLAEVHEDTTYVREATQQRITNFVGKLLQSQDSTAQQKLFQGLPSGSLRKTLSS